jgi:uncharacterized protein (TIGR02246 family)
MKTLACAAILNLVVASFALGQQQLGTEEDKKKIHTLIDQYSEARETKDSELITSILTKDIDQLVSSGTWRRGFDESLKGMLQSSTSNPGSRSLKIETIRFLNKTTAIADARYEISNADGTMRKMWSSFIVTYPHSFKKSRCDEE